MKWCHTRFKKQKIIFLKAFEKNIFSLENTTRGLSTRQ
jgi:hypothetical protein